MAADSLDRLRADFALVIAEGAGSPAEINLRVRDIVTKRVALHAQAEVLLVGDIDRGGVFASLLGTWEWLTRAERALVHGFVLNKFRGDAASLIQRDVADALVDIVVVGLPHLANFDSSARSPPNPECTCGMCPSPPSCARPTWSFCLAPRPQSPTSCG